MILVADDDAQIRDVVRIALTQAGLGVAEAGDGRAALAMTESLQPDLIILDIGMPEMDGLDVCRSLRKTSDVPILFLTARADEIDRVVGLELGADDYVSKPFSPRELVARVRAILKRSQDHIPVQAVLRRGIISALTRSRRGPYLLFKFAKMPKIVSSLPPPFSLFQKMWADIELQEPAIMEYGLDTKATVMLRAIQDHIAYWQANQSKDTTEATVVAPLSG